MKGGGEGVGEATRGNATLNYLGKKNTKNEVRRWRKSNEVIDRCCVDEAFLFTWGEAWQSGVRRR